MPMPRLLASPRRFSTGVADLARRSPIDAAFAAWEARLAAAALLGPRGPLLLRPPPPLLWAEEVRLLLRSIVAAAAAGAAASSLLPTASTRRGNTATCLRSSTPSSSAVVVDRLQARTSWLAECEQGSGDDRRSSSRACFSGGSAASATAAGPIAGPAPVASCGDDVA